MKKTIEMFNPLIVRSPQVIKNIKSIVFKLLFISVIYLYFVLKFMKIMETKLMFPNDARLRNFTYNSNMTLDLNIEYIIWKGEKMEQEERKIVKLPKIQLVKFQL